MVFGKNVRASRVKSLPSGELFSSQERFGISSTYDLPREVDAVAELEPEHLPARERVVALLAERRARRASREASSGSSASERNVAKACGVELRDDLAVVDVRLGASATAA